MLIGDGVSDLLAGEAVHLFVGFGGVVIFAANAAFGVVQFYFGSGWAYLSLSVAIGMIVVTLWLMRERKKLDPPPEK